MRKAENKKGARYKPSSRKDATSVCFKTADFALRTTTRQDSIHGTFSAFFKKTVISTSINGNGLPFDRLPKR